MQRPPVISTITRCTAPPPARRRRRSPAAPLSLVALVAACAAPSASAPTGGSSGKVDAPATRIGVRAPHGYLAANMLPEELLAPAVDSPPEITAPLDETGAAFLAQESYFDRLMGELVLAEPDAADASRVAGYSFANTTLALRRPAAGADFALADHRGDPQCLAATLGLQRNLCWVEPGYRVLRRDGSSLLTGDDMNLCGHVAVAAAVSGLAGTQSSPLASMLFQLALQRDGALSQPLLGAPGTADAGLRAESMRAILAALLQHHGVVELQPTAREGLGADEMLALVDAELAAGRPAIVRTAMVYAGGFRRGRAFRDARIGRLWYSAAPEEPDAFYELLPAGFALSSHWSLVLAREDRDDGRWYRVLNTYTDRHELYPRSVLRSTVAGAGRRPALITFDPV